MKPAAALASLAIGIVLAGCEPVNGPPPGPNAYGPYPADAVAYDGFYDDYYGPFYDGYWGADGSFYYADRDHHFHRDVDHHFQREGRAGFHPVHGGGMRGGGGHPGGEGHR
jgi:hypothetical protein